MTSKFPWQPTVPMDAIVFDCDGTLSQIEGIDILAEQNHVGEIVRELTEQAMGKTGINAELYQKRLELVKPNYAQLTALGQLYFKHVSPDASSVIQIFKKLNKEIYLISAGLNPAVKTFAELVGIPEKNVYAVDIEFDAEGNYLNYNHQAPTANKNGKRKVIAHLKLKHARIMHIGDGLNDYEVYDLVDRFIGYGGATYRAAIENMCDFYLRSPSLLPMLALALTASEIRQLSLSAQDSYNRGLAYIKQGEVKFKLCEEKI